MQQIPLHLLKSLVTVAESSSLEEAAKKIGISQPGLTKQLQQLEVLLPHALFVNEGKKKRLTLFGLELVEQLKDRLKGIDDMIKQTCDRFAKPEESTVRIVGGIGVLIRIMGDLNFPGRLVFKDLSNEKAIKAIADRTADIGISYLTHDSLDVIGKPLHKETFKLVIPKKLLPSAPANLEKALKLVQKLPCLSYKTPDEIMISVFKHYKLDTENLNVKRTFSNFESLVTMANLGLGWAMVPRQFQIDLEKHWVFSIPPSLHPARQFYLYYRKEMAKTAWFKLLRMEIETCYRNEVS